MSEGGKKERGASNAGANGKMWLFLTCPSPIHRTATSPPSLTLTKVSRPIISSSLPNPDQAQPSCCPLPSQGTPSWAYDK